MRPNYNSTKLCFVYFGFYSGEAPIKESIRSSQGRGAPLRNFYDDLYFTEQPYGLVCGFETGLPASDSSSAALT
jgi:hypothetical protein